MNDYAVHPEALANIYRAASIQLFESRVIPALKRGDVVLMDRCYFTSSPVYQNLRLEDLVLSTASNYIDNAFIAVLLPDTQVLIERRPEEPAVRLSELRDSYERLARKREYPIYDSARADIVDNVYRDLIKYLHA